MTKGKGKKWIQKAVKKPGALRKALHIKAGHKIPVAKLKAAAKRAGKTGQRWLALNLRKFNEPRRVMHPPVSQVATITTAGGSMATKRKAHRKGVEPAGLKRWRLAHKRHSVSGTGRKVRRSRRAIKNVVVMGGGRRHHRRSRGLLGDLQPAMDFTLLTVKAAVGGVGATVLGNVVEGTPMAAYTKQYTKPLISAGTTAFLALAGHMVPKIRDITGPMAVGAGVVAFGQSLQAFFPQEPLLYGDNRTGRMLLGIDARGRLFDRRDGMLVTDRSGHTLAGDGTVHSENLGSGEMLMGESPMLAGIDEDEEMYN
jgi:hypothetical protein